MSDILRWLQDEGGRYRTTAPFLEDFAQELTRSGIDVARVTTGIPILHPQVDSLSCLWERGKPVTERRFRLADGGLHQLQNSPMAIVYGRGEAVRRTIGASPEAGEFPIISDLRAQGMTDYLALPLPFSDGSWKAITFVTDHAGGFRPEVISHLEKLVPTLAMILEVHTQHRTLLTLLDTYVGRAAGRRVIEGAIKRGMIETIRAVIWTCDLRGFTELSERLPGADLITLLNDYFGAVTEAIDRRGGEVLKFIGDAVLGIFPLSGESDEIAAERAVAAAREVEEAIIGINAGRSEAGLPLIHYGIALHVGDVLYGNVGGATRLDFTVIGRAVNVATRIEGLSKELGRTVLLSQEMAELCADAVECLGAFPLKGVESEQLVYVLAGDDRSRDTRQAGEQLRRD
jgi:adenylate cyclase